MRAEGVMTAGGTAMYQNRKTRFIEGVHAIIAGDRIGADADGNTGGKERQEWRDAVSQDFEENHLAPLEAQVVATLRAIDRLGPVLSQAHRECS